MTFSDVRLASHFTPPLPLISRTPSPETSQTCQTMHGGTERSCGAQTGPVRAGGYWTLETPWPYPSPGMTEGLGPPKKMQTSAPNIRYPKAATCDTSLTSPIPPIPHIWHPPFSGPQSAIQGPKCSKARRHPSPSVRANVPPPLPRPSSRRPVWASPPTLHSLAHCSRGDTRVYLRPQATAPSLCPLSSAHTHTHPLLTLLFH